MSKQRAKGTRAENKAVAVFSSLFPYCERRALHGTRDTGDLAGLPLPVEVKAGIGQVAEAMAQGRAQAARLGMREHAAYIPAHGKAAAEGYGVVPAWFLVELLACWDKNGGNHGTH